MNNYTKVFDTIKAECEKQKALAEISCFERIARNANIPADRLPLYLNHLQEIGLIKYSMTDKFLHLTALGHKKEISSADTSVIHPYHFNVRKSVS